MKFFAVYSFPDEEQAKTQKSIMEAAGYQEIVLKGGIGVATADFTATDEPEKSETTGDLWIVSGYRST